ncbi:hypothetical protein JQ615_24755 [Bradyrhizobium jicamae]|uniref:Uncharacterized protein n=1 Tax=Bradyrhizobium jicamae TaxID=280332 RepID=A0ABS5FP73_9BRAD|nr:hypothetical protein [Bradyrhizobium jicamae]MBR0798604.1 hypothetical protein [Bradyrhizobium jicamae]
MADDEERVSARARRCDPGELGDDFGSTASARTSAACICSHISASVAACRIRLRFAYERAWKTTEQIAHSAILAGDRLASSAKIGRQGVAVARYTIVI